jgi:hypothetical protein
MPSVAGVLRAMLSRMDATLMWSLVLIGGGAVVAGLVGIALPAGERLAAFLTLVVGAGVGVAALAIGTHNTSSQADAETAFLVASALGFISVLGSAAIVWRRVGAQTLPPPPA